MSRARVIHRWERGVLALILTAAVALTAVANTDAQAIDGPVDVVYIATGNNFADALVASVVAAMNGAPLLTVKSPGDFGDEIPQVTKDKLAELKPARIVVLGGPAAVSDKVFNELRAYSPDVTRVEGEDRFETAALIADLVPDAAKRARFADKAGDADTLDGLDSTAVVHLPLTVAAPADPAIHAGYVTDAVIQTVPGRDHVQPTGGTRAVLILPVPGGPQTVGAAGTAVDTLTELRVCYAVDDAADAITNVALVAPVLGADIDTSLDEQVAWSSTKVACPKVPLPAGGVSAPMPPEIVLTYDSVATGHTHELLLYSVIATWE